MSETMIMTRNRTMFIALRTLLFAMFAILGQAALGASTMPKDEPADKVVALIDAAATWSDRLTALAERIHEPALGLAATLLNEANAKTSESVALLKDALSHQDNVPLFKFKSAKGRVQLSLARSRLTRALSALTAAGHGDDELGKAVAALGRDMDQAFARYDQPSSARE